MRSMRSLGLVCTLEHRRAGRFVPSTSKGGAALEGFGLTLFGLTVRRTPKRVVQAKPDNRPSRRTLLLRWLEEVVLGAGGPPATWATGRRITAEGEPKT